jgi:hypothetical protein
MHHRPNRGDEDRLFGWRRPIDSRLRALRAGLSKIILDVLRRRVGVFQPRPWKIPMNVGMTAGEGVATVLTPAAGARLVAGAEHTLAQPERQPLLADAARALQEERAGEGAAPNRVVEPLAEGVVAMEGK